MSRDQSGLNENIGTDDRGDRKFAVSTNRSGASHRVRYVEAGGAGVDVDECAFCEATPDLSDTAPKRSGEK